MGNLIKITTIEEYNNLIAFKIHKLIPNNLNPNQIKKFKAKAKKIEVLNNEIFIKSKYGLLKYVPEYLNDLKYKYIEEIHEKCHRGINAIFNEIKRKYYNITQEDVKRLLDRCNICSNRKVRVENTTTTPIIIPNKLDRIQLDITYMIEFHNDNNGFKYILTAIDCATKFAWCFPCLQKSAEEVYIHLEDLFLRCIIPKEIHSDNGTEFKNRLIKHLCSKFNVKHVFGRPNHPETQGQIERFNKTIKTSLRSIMILKNTRRWIDILQRTTYEYNIKIHRAIGDSPSNLFLNVLGYNLISNIYSSNNSVSLVELNQDEINSINNYRVRYYSEIASINRGLIRRSESNLRQLGEMIDDSENNE
ncbi:Pro-Pol polyprotein [Dictyocoela muelleri]|nr:Pro-Pol polyprotein [Dictyocoela muelleri]